MDFSDIKNENIRKKLSKVDNKIDYLNTLLDIGFSILEANTDTGHFINLKESVSNSFTNLETLSNHNKESLYGRFDILEEMLSMKDDQILPIENTIKLHNLNLENKFSNEQNRLRDDIKILSDNLTKILNPVVKGGVSEDIIEKIFNNLSNQFSIERTSHISHKGDFIIDGKIMLDVKNYTQTVPQKEINKLVNDLKRNDMDYGMIISINSSISGTSNLPTMVHNSGKKVLLIPSMSFDINTIYIGVLYMNYIEEKSKDNDIGETVFLEALDEMNDIIQHNKNQRSKVELILKTGKELQKEMVNIELKMIDLILKMKENSNKCDGKMDISKIEEKVNSHPVRDAFLLFVNELLEDKNFIIDEKMEIYRENVFTGKISILKNKISVSIKDCDLTINVNESNMNLLLKLLNGAMLN